MKVAMMEEFGRASQFATTDRGGASLDPGQKFGSNFPSTKTFTFGTSSSGNNSNAVRDRSHSPTPTFGSMGVTQTFESKGAARARGKSPDQKSEEEAAKARRLLRFGGELGAGINKSSSDESTAFLNSTPAAGPALERRGRSTSPLLSRSRENVQVSSRQEPVGEPVEDADATENVKSEPILGLCPDMCPEVERGERERKGDLDKFERLDGNRTRTSRDLAVKKYTRTAEKDAVVIRPLPVLRETMGHLLSLLDRDHEDDMLAVHNFLWDRMRAVRMDLRMQHIFGDDAVVMHEQMIRFHILAMHELCEFSEGEGITEVFNAHLNIEQMNKASVDLFQMYDDHAKRGNPVQSEAEFRGYYALLKLDKHPGYRVEAAELSLELAKMRPEIRNSPQIRFARDVARARRSANFVAFFRLARQATYLQACLMHAHFAKLRTQALAAIFHGLQKNQGIPSSVISERLGMEGEEITPLIRYHGFSIKDYEEPYVVKEGPFLNVDEDFPSSRSKLVERKRSSTTLLDVQVQAQRPQDKTMPPNLIAPRVMPRVIPRVLPTVVPRVASGFLPGVGSPVRESMPVVTLNLDKEEEMLDSIESPVDENIQQDKVVDYARRHVRKRVESEAVSEEVDPKPGRKRRMEEPQFENAEHEKRRLRHEADATARRAAAGEKKRKEEQLQIRAQHASEATIGMQRVWFRRWKRIAASKAWERRCRLLKTEAALDSLLLGYPLWTTKISGEVIGPAQRHDFTKSLVEGQGSLLQQMWEPLKLQSLVGPILQDRNPDTPVLHWSVFLSTPDTALGLWVRVKLGGGKRSSECDANSEDHHKKITLVDESTIVIGDDLPRDVVEFRYTVKEIAETDAIAGKGLLFGTGGLLFVTDENESVDKQRARLRYFVKGLSKDANVPLLVLSTKYSLFNNLSSGEDDWNELLRLSDLSSGVSTFRVVSVSSSQVPNSGKDGYFSDEALRIGLTWLASRCPIRPRLQSVDVADLVRDHVDSNLKVLMTSPPSELTPENFIACFNQGLQNAGSVIVSVDRQFPSDVPKKSGVNSTHIEGGGDERQLVRSYHRENGDSVGAIVAEVNSCRLPPFPSSHYASCSGSVQMQKAHLEQNLLTFLSSIEGSSSDSLAIRWEASRMVQRGCSVEWTEAGRMLFPEWGQIFQAIFATRLLRLRSTPWPPVYIARKEQKYNNLIKFEKYAFDKQARVPDFPSDEHLSEEPIVGKIFQSQISVKEKALLLNNGFVADAAAPPPVQNVEILHDSENSLRGVQLQSAAAMMMTSDSALLAERVLKSVSREEISYSSLRGEETLELLQDRLEEYHLGNSQLPYTQSEHLLDEMVKYLNASDLTPSAYADVPILNPLDVTIDRSGTEKYGEVTEQQFCEKTSEEIIGCERLGPLKAGGHCEENYLLDSSPFEVLLDNMAAMARSKTRSERDRTLNIRFEPRRQHLYLASWSNRNKKYKIQRFGEGFSELVLK